MGELAKGRTMKLKEPIEQVIEASGAQFGLALRHLETREELLIDADSYYVLASTFKVPVLVEAFFQIQAG
jgi:beta-lactamase class A